MTIEKLSQIGEPATMLQETSADFEQCEHFISVILDVDQIAAINSPPIWELNPPQREQYESPRDYALGMMDYADRVIMARGERSVKAIEKLSQIGKPFLSPNKQETWATNGYIVARVHEPLTSQTPSLPCDKIAEQFALLEAQDAFGPIVFDAKQVEDLRGENKCGVCGGDYKKREDCPKCDGDGEIECDCCGHERECGICEGRGYIDECSSCLNGWQKHQPPVKLESSHGKAWLKPQSLYNAVSALGEIELRVFTITGMEDQPPVYFTWDGGDGIIAQVRR